MSTEILCSLIALAGAALSALVSFFVAKFSSEREIKKMKLEWEHQDVISSDEDFSDMAVAVSRFVQAQTSKTHTEAITAITKIRAKEYGEIADSLDALYAAIGRRGVGYYPDLQRIDNLLSEILKQKRNAKRTN